jgi:small subunit ribosomal protein S4e
MMTRHLKRLRVPKFWRIPKKAAKWVVRPRPGPHPAFEAFPLQILVKDILGLAENRKEAKAIIKSGQITVDKRPRRDHKFPVGLFDSIEIPKLKQYYRVVPVPAGLGLLKISKKGSEVKICKIVGKRALKGGRFQLNLHDGKNLTISRNGYGVGDSLLLTLPSLKIKKHLKLKVGNLGIVGRGKNSGQIGKIRKIIKRARERAKVICRIGEAEVEILTDQFFVIGEDRPLIEVGR